MAMNAAEVSEIIRGSVSAIEVGRDLGLSPDPSGRCPCPFHNGRDRNMKLYRERGGFYCFVCHEYGDCIKLAMQLLPGLTFWEVAGWFNSHYGLGLPIKEDTTGLRKDILRKRNKMAALYAMKVGANNARAR